LSQDLHTRFAAIYQSNKDRVYRLCRSYLGPVPEVDDLFQEVFLRVWEHLDGFRGEAQASTWVYRIAANTALLWRKRRQRRQQQELVSDDLPLMVAEDTPSEAPPAQLEALYWAIARLKDIDRLLVGMALEGLTYEEMAEVTGRTVNSVGVKMNRIRKRLKKYMEAPHA